MNSHFDEAKSIWENFVPPDGQADTVQGELLRAVEKLRDEATRNGNMNWDDGFELLLDYLDEKLTDPAVYDSVTIANSRAILTRLSDADNPLEDEAAFDALADRVVEYFRHYGTRPHARNPALLR